MIIKNHDELKAWLSTAREEHNLSRRKLSFMAGLSDQSIRRIEETDRMPNLYTLIQLCDVLGYDVIIKKRKGKNNG